MLKLGAKDAGAPSIQQETLFPAQWLCHVPPHFPQLCNANSESVPYVFVTMDSTECIGIVLKRLPLLRSTNNQS